MFYHDPSQPDTQVPSQPHSPYMPVPGPMPGYQAPVQASGYQAPVQAPGYQAPVQAPGYQAPVQAPGYQAPVQAPGYHAPITEQVPALPTFYGSFAPLRSVPLQPMPKPKKSGKSGGRVVALILLSCMIALVFGVGLFSGWVYAHQRTASTSTVASSPKISSSTSNANSTSSTSIEAAYENAIAKAEPSVVEVDGTDAQGETIGSGEIIDKNGDIITNNHVVDGSTSLQVILSNGNTETAQIVGAVASNDLAIIRIKPFTNMQVIALADSAQLTVGQSVLAIGNPLGYNESVSAGVISALNRSVSEGGGVNLSGLIQTSAPINPGNSGGALINLQGQLVGIPTLSAENTETNTPANGIGFAIPSNQVQQVMTQLLGN
jgi:S1-C subfamily serine protease